MNIANCPKCGRLFQKGVASVCPNCIKEIEGQYQTCVKFLRENRKCTLAELSEGTGVASSQILKFVYEGRISVGDMPNLQYDCESCGKLINSGRLCDSCRAKLSNKLQNAEHSERVKQEREKQALKTSFEYRKDL